LAAQNLDRVRNADKPLKTYKLIICRLYETRIDSAQ